MILQALGLKGYRDGAEISNGHRRLKQELAARDIQLVSQWKSVFFSDPSCREAELEAYREHVLFLKEMGSKVISTAEIGGSLHFDPRRSANETEVARLDEAGWQSLAEGLESCWRNCQGAWPEADLSSSWRNGCGKTGRNRPLNGADGSKLGLSAV